MKYLKLSDVILKLLVTQYHYGINKYHFNTLSDITMELSDITLALCDIELFKSNTVVDISTWCKPWFEGATSIKPVNAVGSLGFLLQR